MLRWEPKGILASWFLLYFLDYRLAVTRNFSLSTTSVTKPSPRFGTHIVNMRFTAIPTFKFCGTVRVVSNGNKGLICPQNGIRRMKDLFWKFSTMTRYFRLGPFGYVRICVRVRP